MPLGVPDHHSMALRPLGQELVEPRRDALQVLHAFRQDTGVHQNLAHVVQAAPGRQLVEQAVCDGPVLTGQVCQQPS